MQTKNAPPIPLVLGLSDIAVGLVFTFMLFPRIPLLGWGFSGVGALMAAIALNMRARQRPRAETPQGGPALAAELAKLEGLRQQGAVTEAEYEARKDRILHS